MTRHPMAARATLAAVLGLIASSAVVGPEHRAIGKQLANPNPKTARDAAYQKRRNAARKKR